MQAAQIEKIADPIAIFFSVCGSKQLPEITCQEAATQVVWAVHWGRLEVLMLRGNKLRAFRSRRWLWAALVGMIAACTTQLELGEHVGQHTAALTVSSEIETNQMGWQAQEWPAVASDGLNYLLVWQDMRDGNYNIYGSLLDEVGQPVKADYGISKVSHVQAEVAVTGGANGYLVVWRDERTSGASDIYGVPVDASGKVASAAGFAISKGNKPDWHWKQNPAAAWNGTSYLVVWTDFTGGDANIVGRLVGANGIKLGASNFTIASGSANQELPDVASDGNEFLVVWQDGATGGVGARRVSAAGKLVGGAMTVNSSFTAQSPAVAFGKNEYLVVWERQISGNNKNIEGRLVSGGVPVGSSFTVYFSSAWQARPDVSFDGQDFFVAWERHFNGAGIRGGRLTTSGSKVDLAGFTISNNKSADELWPAVAAACPGHLASTYQRADKGTNRVFMRIISDKTPSCSSGNGGSGGTGGSAQGGAGGSAQGGAGGLAQGGAGGSAQGGSAQGGSAQGGSAQGGSGEAGNVAHGGSEAQGGGPSEGGSSSSSPPAGNPATEASGSCGCRVVGHSRPGHSGLGLLVVALAVLLRRRSKSEQSML